MTLSFRQRTDEINSLERQVKFASLLVKQSAERLNFLQLACDAGDESFRNYFAAERVILNNSRNDLQTLRKKLDDARNSAPVIEQKNI